MIGHMILRKNIDGEDILGLKIVGGQLLVNGRHGAIIEKVKRGSIADQEGHIKPGNVCSFCFIVFVNFKPLFYRIESFSFIIKSISCRFFFYRR